VKHEPADRLSNPQIAQIPQIRIQPPMNAMDAETRDCPGFVPRNQGLSQGFPIDANPESNLEFGFKH